MPTLTPEKMKELRTGIAPSEEAVDRVPEPGFLNALKVLLGPKATEIAANFRGRISSLLGSPDKANQTSPGVLKRVMERVNTFGTAIMNFLSPPTAPAAKPEAPKIPIPVVVPAPVEEKAPVVTGLSPEVQEAFLEADKNHHDAFIIKAENNFVAISNKVSPGNVLKRDDRPGADNLNTLAMTRLQEMKKSGILAHNDKFLADNGCAENISRVYATSGKEVAQDFMNSPKHRSNMLGNHTRLGVAMDGPVFDREKNEYFYYVVALYQGGKSLDINTVPSEQKIEYHDETESNAEILPSYFKALELLIAKTNSTVKFQDAPEEDQNKLQEVQKKAGMKYVQFTDSSGKLVHYLVSKFPPVLTRSEGKGKVSVLFRDVLADFAKADDERVAPKVAESIPVSPEAPQVPSDDIINPS